VLAALALGVRAHAGEVFQDESETQERVRQIQESVSQLRGLPSKQTVPVVVEDPATMRARMEEEMAEQLPEEERHALEATWRALRLVGPDFDVAESFAAVLEEAVAGYFDVEQGRLVLVRRKAGTGNATQQRMMEDMVIAHELVHGLQDQHFDLWGLSRREFGNGDVATAVQCLVEGDASYAMLYRVLPMGADPDKIELDKLAKMMNSAGAVSSTPGGQLGDAPRILREPLIFPYIDGMIFAQAIKVRGGGWHAVDAAYAQPPMSTEQILHPERYGPDGDWPMHLPADASGWVPGYQEIGQDTMGELGVRILLREHGGAVDVDATADGWDGDRLWTLEHDSGAVALVWRTTWDSEQDAIEFERAAQAMVRTMRPDATFEHGRRRLEGEGGQDGDVRHVVRRKKQDVVLLLSVPPRRARRAERRAFRVKGEEIRELDQLAPKPERPERADPADGSEPEGPRPTEMPPE